MEMTKSKMHRFLFITMSILNYDLKLNIFFYRKNNPCRKYNPAKEFRIFEGLRPNIWRSGDEMYVASTFVAFSFVNGTEWKNGETVERSRPAHHIFDFLNIDQYKKWTHEFILEVI